MNNNTPSYKRISLLSNRRIVWLISLVGILISILGFTLSSLNPSIKSPLRPGLDFTGGTQIKLERKCEISSCNLIEASDILEKINQVNLNNYSNIKNIRPSNVKIQVLDSSQSVIVRLPFLSPENIKNIIKSVEPEVAPIDASGISIDTIGPTLGKQLLKSSLISLIAAFSGIAIYISFRFDKKFAFLALLALVHDLIIICGIFSWLGIIYQVEVNSLFAVSLLTIAGYSVNDTVVIFDRIRELNKSDNLSPADKIDLAVSASFTRTIYTSLSTLLPLLSLIFLGGSTLLFFAISLACGVLVGSWSSIALAPTLLSLSLVKTSTNQL